MAWLLLLILIPVFASMAYAAWRGAPWVPTWKRDIARIGRLLDLQPGERFVELGCGDGRVCLALARASGAEAVGVELSFAQWVAANFRRVLSRTRNASFLWQDAFRADLTRADAVYLFLMPETYAKIAPKLEQELKPGARVVSYVWPIPGREPEAVDELEGAPKVYVYQY